MRLPRIRPSRLALGVERIGLVSLAYPLAASLLVIALTLAAGFGLARIQFDDSLSQLFRSDTAEFRQFESLTERFPSSEFDVLVVVEGPHLLDRASVERLRELVIELQFAEGLDGLISMFSARLPPEEDELPRPLFPDELPEGPAYERLIERVLDNDIVRGTLLSEDGELALIVASLDRHEVAQASLRRAIGEIDAIVTRSLAGSGLTAQLSGAPVMQLEIRNALERDRLIYNSLGFLFGCAVAAAFFRRVSFIIIAAAPPLVGVIWSLGALGWLDFRLNMFLNVMTPLILVMGFSDSMQLTFAARDRMLAGDYPLRAFSAALRKVGPACVLTSCAVALSFAALMLSQSQLIRTFGAAGAISAGLTFLAVIAVQPLLGIVLASRGRAPAADPAGADPAIDALRRFCGALAARMTRTPVVFSAVSLLVVVVLTGTYVSLEPRYRLADQVPDREQALSAGARLDAQLGGANPVHILVDFPAGAALYDPETLEVIAEVHARAEEQREISNVWSVETLRRWLAEGADAPDPAMLRGYVEVLPDHLVRRFVSVDEDAVVVTGRIADLDASEILPAVERLDRALDDIRAEHEAFGISVTGLSAIAARNSADMIRNLSMSLTGAMALAALLLGVAFRAPLVSLAAVMPALFPIVISAGLLWALGEGLQFASIVALTVAFGLGLSATIHFINRVNLETRALDVPKTVVVRASVRVGPALMLTTLVLAFGLGVTVLSDLPSLRLFGWLSGVTLLAALLGTLLILPATITALCQRR